MYVPDEVDLIIRYETGELSDEEVVGLFQGLINTGLVWKLQGHYGRTAVRLLEAGVCVRAAREGGR